VERGGSSISSFLFLRDSLVAARRSGQMSRTPTSFVSSEEPLFLPAASSDELWLVLSPIARRLSTLNRGELRCGPFYFSSSSAPLHPPSTSTFRTPPLKVAAFFPNFSAWPYPVPRDAPRGSLPGPANPDICPSVKRTCGSSGSGVPLSWGGPLTTRCHGNSPKPVPARRRKSPRTLSALKRLLHPYVALPPRPQTSAVVP